MDYISIKNLDKYQPHYRDLRKILWIKWDINAHRDYKIVKLTPTQRWLFLGLIALAIMSKKNEIPIDLEWLSQELHYPNKTLLSDLRLLQDFQLIVTTCNKSLQTVTGSPPNNPLIDANGNLITNNALHITHNTLLNADIVIHNEVITDIFNYYIIKTKRKFRLTPTSRNLIKKRLAEGFTVEQLKTAVDNFVLDDWADRHKHLDLVYCIGKQNGKPDNLEKWLNVKPKEEPTGIQKFIKKGV